MGAWAKRLRQAVIRTWHQGHYPVLADGGIAGMTYRMVLGPRWWPLRVLHLVDEQGRAFLLEDQVETVARQKLAAELGQAPLHGACFPLVPSGRL